MLFDSWISYSEAICICIPVFSLVPLSMRSRECVAVGQPTLVLVQLTEHPRYPHFYYNIHLFLFQYSTSANPSPHKPFPNKKDRVRSAQQHTLLKCRGFSLFHLTYLCRDMRTFREKTRKLGAHLLYCMLLPSPPSPKVKNFRRLKMSALSEELEVPSSIEVLNSFYSCEMPLAYRVTHCTRLKCCFNKFL